MRRLVPVLTLALLSPLVAEFLLADQFLFIKEPSPAQLGRLALFLPFYGGGALLIREFARRAGRGWPTILVSALAFGVFEEGLVTQSLFNPNYAGHRLLDYDFVPALGIAGPWTVFVLTLHVVWSIATPIAVAEALFGREPWLRTTGRWIWGVMFVLGAAVTFAVSLLTSDFFLAPLPQLVVVAVIAAALLVWAYRGFGAPAPVWATGNAWLGFAVGLVATTGFQILREALDERFPAWVATLLLLALEGVALIAVLRLRPPAFPLAAGAMVTYGWLGLQTAIHAGPAAAVEQAILVVAALALLAYTATVRGRTREQIAA